MTQYDETYTETLSLTDSYSRVWLATPEFTETLTLSDGDTLTMAIILEEILSLSDFIMGGISKRRIISLTEVKPILISIPSINPKPIITSTIKPELISVTNVIKKL